MRSRQSPIDLLSALILIPSLTLAINIDCKRVLVDKTKFDLHALSGPHSVSWVRRDPTSISNTTFTIDVCQQLKKTGGVPPADECSIGTHVCGIERITNPGDKISVISRVIPIAGEYGLGIGGSLDPQWTRLKTSPSHADSQLEGLRVELNGGKHEKKKQQAVVEFICKRDTEKGLRQREDGDEDTDEPEIDKSGEESEDGAGGTLKFISYGSVDDKSDVLRLKWNTQYACEDAKDAPEEKKKAHWGFFTWFIVVAFLAIAAYLIFGSWLNYNRYGARGWDLLPHGDTIRDIPYLFRDWMRRVMDTVQGSGSRGGYSAV